ncbi:MAG: hypothetical protein ACRDRZ_13505 [Pseudonocardiaceae bacterium]
MPISGMTYRTALGLRAFTGVSRLGVAKVATGATEAGVVARVADEDVVAAVAAEGIAAGIAVDGVTNGRSLLSVTENGHRATAFYVGTPGVVVDR